MKSFKKEKAAELTAAFRVSKDESYSLLSLL